MRILEPHEINTITGGGTDDIICSVGIPSGVTCEGSVGDFKAAVQDAWTFLAGIPGTMPFAVEHFWAKL